MKGFDVLHVKSGIKNHNKFDLSKSHLTTMDFGEIVPLYVEETVPGDKFSVSANYFSRMAPLVKPTYGKFSFKTVNAFVPYHMLANDAEAWFAGKTSWEGMTPQHRTITPEDILRFAMNYGTSVASTAAYDFTYTTTTGSVAYSKLNSKGKYFIKVLNALGYALPEGADLQTGSTWKAGFGSTKLSAYPLLAFFKLYNDYMSQSQRFNTSQLSNLLNAIKYGRGISGSYAASTGTITYQAMITMFNNLKLNYENDYFTSAWQQPNNAINNYEGQTGILIPGAPGEGIVSAPVDDNKLTLDVYGDDDRYVTLGQRALDFLKSFDDWVRRNNYSGSRAVQQIYSRFGIKTDDYKSHYAHVISTNTSPIQVGDVTATADSQNVPLGDYAGKAIMNDQNGFSIQVSDYGVILILGYFTVAPMMSFGFDRRVLRNQPLDYYNPEFDGIGADAISVGEVWSSPIETDSSTTDNAVFGYTERYNSYRYGRDVITGEFRDYNANGDMNCWHTGRNLAGLRHDGELVAQSSSMNTLPQTNSEYNRIFSVTDDSVNHFYLTCQFKVNAVRPMLNLNQVTKLGEGDTNVPRNGNVIS